MAAIVDLTYYTGSYLLGRAAVVPNPSFGYYEKAGERAVNRALFGQLSVVPVTEDLKDCICEVAEYLITVDKAVSAEAGGVLTSYSNDGDSGTIDRTGFRAEDANRSVQRIVKKYFGGTEYMKAGVEL